MPTQAGIAQAVALCTASRLRNGPATPEEYTATSSAWLVTLGAMTDTTLAAAVGAHIRTPGAGAWWPTPAELLAAAGAVAQLAAAGPESEAVEAWERIMRRLSGALPPPADADRYSVGDILTAEQMTVLQGLGGMWALRRTDEGPALGSFRKRFLDGCVFAVRPKARLVTGYGGTRLLTDPVTGDADAADRIRRMLGTGEDQHADKRARANAQGRGE